MDCLRNRPETRRRDFDSRLCRTDLFSGRPDGGSNHVAWSLGMRQGGEALACTMAFSALTLARLFHGFNCRSSYSTHHAWPSQQSGQSGGIYAWEHSFGSGSFCAGAADVFCRIRSHAGSGGGCRNGCISSYSGDTAGKDFQGCAAVRD